MMPIAVSGANGFTGRFVCCELQRRGHAFVSLMRPRRRCLLAHGSSDLRALCRSQEPSPAPRSTGGLQGLLNVASIGFGAAPLILQVCQAPWVTRAVFEHHCDFHPVERHIQRHEPGCGCSPHCAQPHHRNPHPINNLLNNGGSARDPAGPMVQSLASATRVWPSAIPSAAGPCLRSGLGRAASPRNARHPRQAIQHLWRSSTHLQRRGASDSQGPWSAHPAASHPCPTRGGGRMFTEQVGLRLPLKAERILRPNEDKACSHTEAAAMFGYAPMAIEQGIQREVPPSPTGVKG